MPNIQAELEAKYGSVDNIPEEMSIPVKVSFLLDKALMPEAIVKNPEKVFIDMYTAVIECNKYFQKQNNLGGKSMMLKLKLKQLDDLLVRLNPQVMKGE